MPKAPDGNVYVAVNAYGKMVPHGASICSTNENIVETVKWLDWHYSEEATTLYNWGIEGQSYEVVDGKKQFTDLILNNPDGLSKDEPRHVMPAASSVRCLSWKILKFSSH